MAVPKNKTSHARTHNRKAKWLGALKSPAMTTCSQCGEVILTHRACPECGYYRGRKVKVEKASGEGQNDES
ncbi:MAG TPA: 50S ribosomal protein L32 [Synergistaceae bacterium]|jgi:large subunit ribosomal protein L32|nr:MAG: 50S ribosomal protein L32 [Synergistales bacterium 54_9]HAA47737.1 50S ribosomal protein L32 [Synergistaceae bacterium]HAG21842.1 50S ribosomal protein L32 [Synergistaceae bacterium]